MQLRLLSALGKMNSIIYVLALFVGMVASAGNDRHKRQAYGGYQYPQFQHYPHHHHHHGHHPQHQQLQYPQQQQQQQYPMQYPEQQQYGGFIYPTAYPQFGLQTQGYSYPGFNTPGAVQPNIAPAIGSEIPADGNQPVQPLPSPVPVDPASSNDAKIADIFGTDPNQNGQNAQLSVDSSLPSGGGTARGVNPEDDTSAYDLDMSVANLRFSKKQ